MDEPVLVERVENVAVVTINNPKARNALSREVLHRLLKVLNELSEDRTCRALVITGAGSHFSGGADITPLLAERSLSEGRFRLQLVHQVTRAFASFPKPVISAVEGYAAGAGLSLVAASDYAVSSSSAKYMAAFAKVGLMPDMGLLWTLPQRIGLPHAKRMFATACIVQAEEALRLGLVEQIVESGKALETAIEVAKSYTVCAPMPMAVMKAAYASGIATLEDALRSEMDNQAALFLTKDNREGVSAFMEKRPPVFLNE